MRKWFRSRCLISAGLRDHIKRHYSAATNDVERVAITGGSSGDTIIDLHNISKLSPESPLLIYLPPFSTASIDKPFQLPTFLKRRPTVVVNYHWDGFSPFETSKTKQIDPPASTDGSNEDESSPPPLSWPVPIHDTTRAYDWIIQNLSPPHTQRRNIYLYGSYLGASLAVSLALTETRPHERMAVRGCVAFNGIYNWTKFLADHPINNPDPNIDAEEEVLLRQDDAYFRQMKQYAEALFGNPNHLFDPFASPTLFFITPGLYAPSSFTESALSPGEELLLFKPPKSSRLVFPPRTSTLRIPETLLLHTKPPPLPPSVLKQWYAGKDGKKNKAYPGNNFQSQAEELGKYMRLSIDKAETLRDFSWEGLEEELDKDFWTKEADRRIQIHDVGGINKDHTLGRKGEEVVAPWLELQLSGRPLRTSDVQDLYGPRKRREQ
ncbi:uncharacterized protein F4812DRAFT_410536 [Daldinia caldariorum]|uniref:uncharacterized protein n=1 Tax=Daldinia caldariorum TaxID=326644 RepID=UPI00200826C1|nr:uncharacterized protein F4812DRAFT_410536 [Daldinia caldariorum]KAI1472854.1 hypothetical protein F4812DRAFT_410536 [Daldinia caldariorum]